MKLFKFTLLMAGIILYGSILGQTLPSMSMQVQKGVGLGATPDLYRVYDTNVVDISVSPGDYGDKVVSLDFVIKRDGQVINNLSDYGWVTLFLPGTSNYKPKIVFPDTTFQVTQSQGAIPSREFCYNSYHRNYPDGLSLNLLRGRKLRLTFVWKVSGTYTVEWILRQRDSAYDAKGNLLSEYVHLTTNIDESFLTKKGAVLLQDLITMQLIAPAMTYRFPDTIDVNDNIDRVLDIAANCYVAQKGFVAYRVEHAPFGSSSYNVISSGSGLDPYGHICITSTDKNGYENTMYSTCLSGTGAFGATGNHALGTLGKLDTLNNMVSTEMYREGDYRVFLWLVHEREGIYDTLVSDTVHFVTKKMVHPMVAFTPDVPVSISVGAEFFAHVQFKANDYAHTTGKISFVVKKDGVEIPVSQLPTYGYLQIGDKILTDGSTVYPTSSTILLGRCDTTLRIDAKWSVPGTYTIEAYEDQYMDGTFHRHLASDVLTMKVDNRQLPFLVLYPYMYPDTVINYTKNAYYWFDLVKMNGWDYRREWVDLKFDIEYSTDSVTWNTATYTFDELGFMYVQPSLNNGDIVEKDTIRSYSGMFPFTKVDGKDALIRLGALDTCTRVDIRFTQAGFYRIVYSFEQWLYPHPSSGAGSLATSFIGGQGRYNSVPIAWLSHDTTIFHIKDSVLPSGELVPNVRRLATDKDHHLGVVMHAGSYQYPEYTVPVYINYELMKKGEDGVYSRVGKISNYGYFSMTYNNQMLSGKSYGRIPVSKHSTHFLENLHNDTLFIDLRCKRSQAGDYGMRVQIIQYDTNRFGFPDTIRHGLLHDTVYYFTFDSLEPTLTVVPNDVDPYSVGAEYYHYITLNAHGFESEISDIEYEIYRNGVLLDDVTKYADFRIGDRQITKGKGTIPGSPVMMGLLDTTVMSTTTWDSTGLYEVVYRLRGYDNGVPVTDYVVGKFTARVVERELPFLVLYPYMYPDTIINYTKGAYYWFDLIKRRGWEYRREYVDLEYVIEYSTDSVNWSNVGLSFDDHGFMNVVPKLNTPAGTEVLEDDTLHTWTGKFPMKSYVSGSDLIRLGALDTCTKVDILFKKAGFYRIVYMFRQYNYPVMGPNSYVGNTSKHPEVKMIARLSHDTTIFHVKDSVLPHGELVPNVTHLATDRDYHIGVKMDAGSYQYPEYTVPVYINYELLKEGTDGVYSRVGKVSNYGYFSMT
nr:hypothetical protein [Bacteroidales bacterium]